MAYGQKYSTNKKSVYVHVYCVECACVFILNWFRDDPKLIKYKILIPFGYFGFLRKLANYARMYKISLIWKYMSWMRKLTCLQLMITDLIKGSKTSLETIYYDKPHWRHQDLVMETIYYKTH